MTRSWGGVVAVLVAIVSALALAVDGARRASACYDEPKHLATALLSVAEGRFVGDDNSPLVVLHALPFAGSDLALPPVPEARPNGKRTGLFAAGVAILADHGIEATLFRARLASVALFGALLLLLAFEGFRRGGAWGGAIAVLLAGFEPSLLAHASLVSADLPLAVAAAACVVAWGAFARRPSWPMACLLALALAACLLAKLTGAVAWIAVAVAAVLSRRALGREGLAKLGIAAVVALGLVVLATPGDPFHLLRVARLVRGYAEASGGEYFAGTLGAASPFFYPAVLALKVEPAGAVLALLGIVAACRRRVRGLADLSCWLALAFFVAVAASGYRQGIRFLLPVFPLLALAAAPLGRALATADSRRAAKRFGVAALLALHVLAAWRAHPGELAYWNAFARGGGDRWFVDSNHDWGQDLLALRDWHEAHPEARLFGLLYSSVPPAAYGLRYDDLFADPATFAPFDTGADNWLAISATLLRVLPGQPPSPQRSIAEAFADREPDALAGASIRLHRITATDLRPGR